MPGLLVLAGPFLSRCGELGRLDPSGLARCPVGPGIGEEGKLTLRLQFDSLAARAPILELVAIVAVFTVACFKRVPFSFFPFQIIKSLGYNRLVLQIGRGKVVPEPFSTESFTLDVYRYKDSLKEDLQKADLVISHAGKGP